jgi:hypothetical protein
MKKILITSTLLVSSIFAMNIKENDLLIKKNIVYLINQQKQLDAKVKVLEEKLNSSNAKISILTNKIEKLKNNKSTKPTYILKKEIISNKKVNEDLNSILPHMYRVVYSTAPAYNNPNGKGTPKHIYKHLDIVKVIHKNKNFWQLHNGLWMNKECLTQMIKSKEKFNYSFKISFFKVGTYMVNVREKPSVNSSVVRVLRKNDIVKVIKWIFVKEKRKNGEIVNAKWAKLDNGLYIKAKLLVPLY